MSDGEWVVREVANPEHVELVELLARVRPAVAEATGLLNEPARLMGSGQAWTGSATAETFATGLEGRRIETGARLGRFVDAVEYRVARVPQTVEHRTRVW